MTDMTNDVLNFHSKFGICPTDQDDPRLLDGATLAFRLAFMAEETLEWTTAHQKRDMAGCLDALLDGVYVGIGTVVLMGATNWRKSPWRAPPNMEVFSHAISYSDALKQPCFLDDDGVVWRTERALDLVLRFTGQHRRKDPMGCMTELAAYCVAMMETASLMGLTSSWDEGWDLVHSKNMQKERASAANLGKRGSALDVVKPLGWMPPDHSPILVKHGWLP